METGEEMAQKEKKETLDLEDSLALLGLVKSVKMVYLVPMGFQVLGENLDFRVQRALLGFLGNKGEEAKWDCLVYLVIPVK